MSAALENAKAEKLKLEADAAAIKQRIGEIDQFLRLYASFESGSKSAINPETGNASAPITAKRTILSVALEILSDGFPYSTKELLNELSRRGIDVGGEDKITNLSSILSRAKDSVQFERGQGWVLKKERPESVAADSDLI